MIQAFYLLLSFLMSVPMIEVVGVELENELPCKKKLATMVNSERGEVTFPELPLYSATKGEVDKFLCQVIWASGNKRFRTRATAESTLYELIDSFTGPFYPELQIFTLKQRVNWNRNPERLEWLKAGFGSEAKDPEIKTILQDLSVYLSERIKNFEPMVLIIEVSSLKAPGKDDWQWTDYVYSFSLKTSQKKFEGTCPGELSKLVVDRCFIPINPGTEVVVKPLSSLRPFLLNFYELQERVGEKKKNKFSDPIVIPSTNYMKTLRVFLSQGLMKPALPNIGVKTIAKGKQNWVIKWKDELRNADGYEVLKEKPKGGWTVVRSVYSQKGSEYHLEVPRNDFPEFSRPPGLRIRAFNDKHGKLYYSQHSDPVYFK